MPYDDNSFSQGIAVGRSLKGMSVVDAIVPLANNNGTLTIYAVGTPPSAAMTIQVTLTEVEQ